MNEQLRVVIADDEETVVLLLRLQLSKLGVEVIGTAGDGDAAVALCRELRPDAVVMDLLMPKLNGFEAIERIKAEAPDVGIVAYSAVAGEIVRAEMARLEVPLVLKSGNPARLLEAIYEASGRAGHPDRAS